MPTDHRADENIPPRLPHRSKELVDGQDTFNRDAEDWALKRYGSDNKRSFELGDINGRTVTPRYPSFDQDALPGISEAKDNINTGFVGGVHSLKKPIYDPSKGDEDADIFPDRLYKPNAS